MCPPKHCYQLGQHMDQWHFRSTPINFTLLLMKLLKTKNVQYFSNIIINNHYITSTIHLSSTKFTICFNSAALQTRKMFSACTFCYSNFSTPSALKQHERRFHPTTRTEQILCKPCNMPFSNQYYFKRHNAKYHNSKVSSLTTPYMDTKQNEESGNTQIVKEDYTEKLHNLEINQQRSEEYILKNSLYLLKFLELTKELSSAVKAMKEYQAEEIKTKTYSCGICNKIYKHSSSLLKHKSRFHPKSHREVQDQLIKDSLYYLPSLQTLNNA